MSDLIACHCVSYQCSGQFVTNRTHWRHLQEDELHTESQLLLEQSHARSFSDILSDLTDPRNKPLFVHKAANVSSSWTKLGFVTSMLKIKADFPGVTRNCFDAMMKIIQSMFMDCGFQLNFPNNFDECRAMVSDVMPPCNKIDACKNACILFRGQYSDATACPKCGEPRKDENGKSIMVYYHLPLIPRLHQMFSVDKLAKLMQNHSYCNSSVVSTDVWDSEIWKRQYATNGPFSDEKRCLSFGYSTDGMQPFQHLNIPYSIWPQVLKMYNLPPIWRDKMEMLMLVGIIPGPKTPTDMGVFHELLIEELLELESGIQMWDASQKEMFILKGDIILYTMDWPARCKCFKYKSATSLNACPYCKIKGKRLATLDKTVFIGSQHFLPSGHPIKEDQSLPTYKLSHTVDVGNKSNEDAKYGKAIDEIQMQIKIKKTTKTTGIRALQAARKIIEGKTGKTGEDGFSKLLSYRCNGQNAVAIDWMHCGKNMAKDLVELLTGRKDCTKSLRQEHELGRFEVNSPEIVSTNSTPRNSIKRKQSAQAGSRKKAKQPDAPFILSHVDKKMADQRISNIKVPINFSYRPRPLFDHAHGMKSIEWIKVFTDGIIQYALRGMLGQEQRRSLIKFCEALKELNSPIIYQDKLEELTLRVNEAMSEMEQNFPVSLKSLMFHLAHHLPAQIKRNGPLSSHSMFVFERFMGFLGKRMTSHRYPEMTAVNSWRITYLANLIQLCGKGIPQGMNFESSTNDDEEEDESSNGDASSENLMYLKGGMPMPQLVTLAGRDLYFMKEYHMYRRQQVSSAVRTTKYFAGSWQHPTTKRVHEYRCEEKEGKMCSVSSVVGIVRSGSVFFGRIQFFISQADKSVEEVVYVKWFGEGRVEKETGLWVCERTDYPMNPFCHPLELSPPLVHVWETDSMLWILNYHMYRSKDHG